jgi:hypothetical protein
MISSHYAHIATRHGAYLFLLKKLFSFVNFKFSSFAMVIFAYELIPAMGAPAASVDLPSLLPDCFEEITSSCTVSQQNNCKNIFRPLFCHFLQNLANLRHPICSGRGQFLGPFTMNNTFFSIPTHFVPMIRSATKI